MRYRFLRYFFSATQIPLASGRRRSCILPDRLFIGRGRDTAGLATGERQRLTRPLNPGGPVPPIIPARTRLPSFGSRQRRAVERGRDAGGNRSPVTVNPPRSGKKPRAILLPSARNRYSDQTRETLAEKIPSVAGASFPGIRGLSPLTNVRTHLDSVHRSPRRTRKFTSVRWKYLQRARMFPRNW